MKKHDNLATRLQKGSTMIHNALDDPQILGQTTAYGYTPEKLQSALKMVEEVILLNNHQQVEYGEQYQASENFERAFTAAYKLYIRNIKLARIAFSTNTEARVALMLDGDRKQSFSGWQKQANTFYSNLLANKSYLETISRYNINAQQLTIEQQAINELTNLSNLHQKEKGEAIEATKHRDEKVDQLDKFIAEFVEICKIVFEEKSEVLKMLGIVG